MMFLLEVISVVLYAGGYVKTGSLRPTLVLISINEAIVQVAPADE